MTQTTMTSARRWQQLRGTTATDTTAEMMTNLKLVLTESGSRMPQLGRVLLILKIQSLTNNIWHNNNSLQSQTTVYTITSNNITMGF
jgi:hypothetical protein